MTDTHLLYQCLIPVRWGDMDSYAHVNNTQYLRYLEEARIQWFAQIGIDLQDAPQGPVLLQVQHSFLRPVQYPATLRVQLHAGDLGRSSLVLQHRLYLQDDPTLLGEGYCKLVWIEHASARSTALPEQLRAQWPVMPAS
ncbi:MAG: acyl-CoA thioesterase [Burkholderiaceae bacterium]|nr:MAG: acyl-CoA thioesterase [Burkholderiaceae bacterium]